MSESPTRRIVASAPGEASSEVVAASEELAIGTSHRHRGIKSRHFRAPPPSSHRLLRRVLAACLACALVVAVFKVPTSKFGGFEGREGLKKIRLSTSCRLSHLFIPPSSLFSLKRLPPLSPSSTHRPERLLPRRRSRATTPSTSPLSRNMPSPPRPRRPERSRRRRPQPLA